ncbi:MAG: hypothetical protein KBA87_04015 [Lachnospiraceae bacterium]|jgi:cytochrome c oxidase assembly protein Cox11|nr:hypothetical protein [Lachnospiraceae bacterium]
MSDKVSKNSSKMQKQKRTKVENKLLLYACLSIFLCVVGLITLAMVLSHTNMNYVNQLISSMKY